MTEGLFNKLVTQNSNLRLLKFGKDLPGAGTSRQPYVTKPLPGVEDPLPTNSPDFLLRQGTLQRIADDETRFFKYFTSTQGLAFIAKQNLLSLTSVRTQASQGPSNQGTYLPTNTSAQLAANPFGGHLNFLGVDPTGLLGGIRKYGDLVNPPLGIGDIAEADNNRLVSLSKDLGFISREGEEPENQEPGRLRQALQKAREFLSNGKTTLFSYSGGPGSAEGIGQTNIYRYSFTPTNTNIPSEGPGILSPLGVSNSWFTFTQLVDSVSFPELTTGGGVTFNLDFNTSVYKSGSLVNDNDIIEQNNTQTYTQDQLIQQEKYSYIGQIREDFRKNLRNQINSPSYSGDKAWDIRTNAGDPGYIGNDRTSYTQGNFEAVDKINALPIYQSIGSEGQTGRVDTTKPINDLIKFRIAVIDNGNPETVNYIHFRAFIDSFSDSYSGDWSSERYPGRGEEFFRYSGFSRQISLSFTSAAQSKQELIPMYKKLNYLASNTMNDYSPSGYMRPPFIKLTIGGYLYEQFGFIRSLNYDWEMKAPFEIGINDIGGEDTNVKELPHVIRVTGFQFQPIYQFLPQKQSLTFDKNGNLVAEGFERYIALSAGDNDNYISGSITT